MLALFGVLIIIASVVLGLIVLIQNPKGGGLSGTLAGFNNQFMGVKQTTDVLEKGTWVLAVAIALLSIFSPVFINQTGVGKNEPNLRPVNSQSAPVTAPQSAPPAPAK